MDPEKIDFNPPKDMHMVSPLNLAAEVLSKGVPFLPLPYPGFSCTACKPRMYYLDCKSGEARDAVNQLSCFFPPTPHLSFCSVWQQMAVSVTVFIYLLDLFFKGY